VKPYKYSVIYLLIKGTGIAQPL